MNIPVGERVEVTPYTTEEFLTQEQAQSVVDAWGEYIPLNQGTAQHCLRVSYLFYFAAFIAQRRDLIPADYDLRVAVLGGLLHDIGKTHPDVRKHLHEDGYFHPDKMDLPGRKSEFHELRFGHCEKSGEMLKVFNVDNIHPDIALMARQHHMDMSDKSPGYPNREPNEEICKLSNLLAYIDRFHAIQAGRGYSEAMAPENAKKCIDNLVNEGKLNRDFEDTFEEFYHLYMNFEMNKLDINVIGQEVGAILGFEQEGLRLEIK